MWELKFVGQLQRGMPVLTPGSPTRSTHRVSALTDAGRARTWATLSLAVGVALTALVFRVSGGKGGAVGGSSSANSAAIPNCGIDAGEGTSADARSRPQRGMARADGTHTLLASHSSAPEELELSPSGFATFQAFPDAAHLQLDFRFNPRRRTLDAPSLELLNSHLAALNEALASMQNARRQRLEDWGKILIENGMIDPSSHDLPLALPVGAARVAVAKDGVTLTTTVRPGDNAELDLMCVRIHEFVHDTEAWIGAYFEQ